LVHDLRGKGKISFDTDPNGDYKIVVNATDGGRLRVTAEKSGVVELNFSKSDGGSYHFKSNGESFVIPYLENEPDTGMLRSLSLEEFD
jgi:hypothetical protein